MTSSFTVLTHADADQLPRPSTISQQDGFGRGLPRPAPVAEIVDSGRISFGGAYRLPSKK